MFYSGRVLITDEAIEVYKEVNLFSAWNVKASWDNEGQTLQVDCEPSDLSFNWPWKEIESLINLGIDNIPSIAIEIRDRDAIA
ncbi:hypothetical protein [Sporosarcina sp. P29]|uniref:hypothetical protein n=1 Tax=Sporosarcina sp. P29 TaxID=2048252 RepID=UPI000C16345E|nr:hypothetical protein [Sporosarcina sp. P29]PIC98529.1 hypothetical protein CSV68_12690 [Sporosarcina sp. P29]